MHVVAQDSNRDTAAHPVAKLAGLVPAAAVRAVPAIANVRNVVTDVPIATFLSGSRLAFEPLGAGPINPESDKEVLGA